MTSTYPTMNFFQTFLNHFRNDLFPYKFPFVNCDSLPKCWPSYSITITIWVYVLCKSFMLLSSAKHSDTTYGHVQLRFFCFFIQISNCASFLFLVKLFLAFLTHLLQEAGRIFCILNRRCSVTGQNKFS